jgi:hypothetical protein
LPPYTLAAFTAYLSQNHCLETLEFVTDVDRYTERYKNLAAGIDAKVEADFEELSLLHSLWQRMMETYIKPNGQREVNLPSDVRDHLLSAKAENGMPPGPEKLTEARQRIFDLMDESVLMTFITEVTPKAPSINEGIFSDSDDAASVKGVTRSTSQRTRRRKQSPANMEVKSYPFGSAGSRISYHSGHNRDRLIASHTNTSSGSSEMVLAEDAGNLASPEPMTPPTTPPSSDLGSPRSRSENTWNRIMGRLGPRKKSGNRMNTAGSS